MASISRESLVAAAAQCSFSVEVIDYYLQDDSNFYQNHIFIIQMFLEQNEIRLYRSYAAFCELDTKLRRQYPRSSIPALPLAGLSAFQKKGGKRFSILSGNSQGAANSNIAPNAAALDVRESMIANHDKSKAVTSALQRPSIKRSDNNQELISNRKPYLTRYLNELLKIPEVVMSDTFHIFLDEESPMDNHPSHIPEYNEESFQGLEINLILQDEISTTKTISKDFMLPMSVYEGGVVVWSFETKQRDIGFSIAFDGKEIVAYQRVQSHMKPVQGYFEVPKAGQMLFQWDNTYSKWRNKQMSYVVKVVDKEKFRSVLDQASSMVREKVQKHKQRVALKKVLSKIAHDTMFAAGSNDNIQQRMQQQQLQQQQQQKHDHLSTIPEDDSAETKPSTSVDTESSSPLRDSAAVPAVSSLTDITAFYPPPALPPPPQTSTTNYPRLRSSIYSTTASETTDNDDVSVTSRSSTLLPSAADQEITIKVLNQQIDTLKSEKQFLQHALAQAETALVQERSACASNFQQVEDMTMSKEMMEEELQTLQEENESLRKEIHELIQQQQETNWLTSSASSKLLESLSTTTTTTDGSHATGNDAAGGGGVTFSDQEKDTLRMLMEMSMEEFLLHYQPPKSSSSGHGTTDNSIRQLLALHHFPGLVAFARELMVEKSTLHEKLSQTEAQYIKQKALSKQLKTAAIQLKEQQTETATVLKQTEHEKELIVAENESLAVKVRSYENQIRVLQREWREMHEAYQAVYARYVQNETTSGGNPVTSTGLTPVAAVSSGTATVAPPVENTANISRSDEAATQQIRATAEDSSSSRKASPIHSTERESPPLAVETEPIQASTTTDPNDDTSEKKIPPPSPGSIAERMKLLAQKNQQKKAAAAAAATGGGLGTVASTAGTVSSPARRSNLSDAISSSDSAIVSPFPHPQSFQHLASISQSTTYRSASTAALPTPAQFLQKFEQQQDQLTVNGQGSSSSSMADAADDEPPADYIAQFQPPPPPKIVVHDFAKAEPDEISAYLSQMTSSFMSMLGVDEEEWDAHMEDDESSPRVKEEELTTFRSTTGGAAQTSGSPPSTGTIRRQSGGVSSGLMSNSTSSSTLSGSQSSSSFLSSLKQMSFGF